MDNSGLSPGHYSRAPGSLSTMSKRKIAVVTVACVLALIFVHVTLGVDSNTKWRNKSFFTGQRFSKYDCPELFQRGDFFHHVYGNSARVSDASMLCAPGQWQPKSWRGEHPASGEHLFASEAAQQQIWQHQHPEDCSSVKQFLLYGMDGTGGHGIGSTLHYATWALAKAIELDRVLLFVPTPEGPWSQGNFCEGYLGLHDCYFEPVSSCSFADVMGIASLSEVPNLDDGVPQHDQRLLQSGISHLIWDVPLVPSKLRTLLQGSPVPEDRITFWFRSQAIAFLVRPNMRTLYEIRNRRQQQSWTTIPSGTISIHIRHGDKGIEMPLAPDADYLSKAEELVKQDTRLQRTIFLSTEDPASIQLPSKVCLQ